MIENHWACYSHAISADFGFGLEQRPEHAYADAHVRKNVHRSLCQSYINPTVVITKGSTTDQYQIAAARSRW